LQVPCKELMELFFELNGSLRCFEHTLEEIYRVLNAAVYRLKNTEALRNYYGETIDFFITENYQSSDVLLILERLQPLLNSINIRVVPKPTHSMPLGVDEERLEKILQEIVVYNNPKALYHDMDSLTAIHRIRKGENYKKIELSKAIFITSNNLLKNASDNFFDEEYGEEIKVPHCMLDHAFTTLIWLKKPLKAPNLPRNKIIADCYAAMNPSDSLWKKYLDEISKLQKKGNITETDYNILRYSMDAKSALMDSTLGDPEAFVEGTIAEVLQKAKSTVRREIEIDLDLEKIKRKEAEERAKTAEFNLDKKTKLILDKISIISSKIANFVSSFIFIIFFILIICASYFTMPNIFPSFKNNVPEAIYAILIPFVLIILFFISILNLAFGTTLKIIRRKIKVYLSKNIEKIIIRIFMKELS
jgi:hypothetical protein